MAAGRVHLLYGLAGSGKTTLARALCAEESAVRFTLDEWMIRLYPGLSFDSAEYGRQADVVKELIWSLAEQVLRSGVDVVLDWNSWSRARRAWAVHRAATVPATVILHRLGASVDQATARLEERDRDPRFIHVHPIDRQGNEHLASIMEPPSEAGGFSIVDELPCAWPWAPFLVCSVILDKRRSLASERWVEVRRSRSHATRLQGATSTRWPGAGQSIRRGRRHRAAPDALTNEPAMISGSIA